MGEGPKDMNLTRDAESTGTASIRAEIEQKRSEISETLNEIQERLTPRNIVSQATGSVRDATTSGIRQVRGAASDAATQVASSTRRAAARTAEQAREHPWSTAAAVAGVGAAAWWLATRSPRANDWDYDNYSEESLYADEDFAYSSGNGGVAGALKAGTLPVVLTGVAVGYWLWRRNSAAATGYASDSEIDYDSAWNGGTYGSAGADAGSYRSFEGNRRWKDEESLGSQGRLREVWSGAASRAREAAAAAGERTRDVATRAQQRLTDGSRQVASQAERWIDENPLAAGAAALLAGLIVGLAVPESERERQLMGGPRRRLITRAQQAGRNAVGRAKQTLVDAAAGRRAYQR